MATVFGHSDQKDIHNFWTYVPTKNNLGFFFCQLKLFGFYAFNKVLFP